jgi:glycosyltransferase involved in cell wall biosynthesis
MKTVSAAIIGKNEERTVIRCLESLVGAVDEIVFVDTGSSDKTLQLVLNFAKFNPSVKVYHFPWCDDFSAARNYALDQVSSDWVLVVDCDEVLFEDDQEKVRQVVNEYGKSPVLYGLYIDHISIAGDEILDRQSIGVLRIFPSHPEIRYSGIIHESLGDGFNFAATDIRLIHDGYDPDQVDPLAKKKRNLNLLNAALQEDPYNARNLMYFGLEIMDYDLQKGLTFIERARKHANGDKHILEMIDICMSKMRITDISEV